MSNDLPVLDKSVLMSSLGDDQELIREIFDLFTSTTPEIIESLETAADQGNVDLVKRNAHSLKGSAGNIGAIALQESMRVLEITCTEGDAEAIRIKVTDSINEYNRLKSELNA